MKICGGHEIHSVHRYVESEGDGFMPTVAWLVCLDDTIQGSVRVPAPGHTKVDSLR